MEVMYNLYLSITNTDFKRIYTGNSIETAIRIIAQNSQVLSDAIYTDAEIMFAYITDSFGNIVYESCYNKRGI